MSWNDAYGPLGALGSYDLHYRSVVLARCQKRGYHRVNTNISPAACIDCHVTLKGMKKTLGAKLTRVSFAAPCI
jgi:hypothetical protein